MFLLNQTSLVSSLFMVKLTFYWVKLAEYQGTQSVRTNRLHGFMVYGHKQWNTRLDNNNWQNSFKKNNNVMQYIWKFKFCLRVIGQQNEFPAGFWNLPLPLYCSGFRLSRGWRQDIEQIEDPALSSDQLHEASLTVSLLFEFIITAT